MLKNINTICYKDNKATYQKLIVQKAILKIIEPFCHNDKAGHLDH